MEIDDMLAYAEIDEILNLLEDEDRDKIPENVRKFFKEEKMPDYNPTIDLDIPLTKQNLKRETIVLLSMLNIKYWCESEEEKQSFINELDKNEEKKKELEEKYNPDNLFKRNEERIKDNEIKEENVEVDNTQENLSVVEYKKPNFIQRLLDKIIMIFKK